MTDPDKPQHTTLTPVNTPPVSAFIRPQCCMVTGTRDTPSEVQLTFSDRQKLKYLTVQGRNHISLHLHPLSLLSNSSHITLFILHTFISRHDMASLSDSSSNVWELRLIQRLNFECSFLLSNEKKSHHASLEQIVQEWDCMFAVYISGFGREIIN